MTELLSHTSESYGQPTSSANLAVLSSLDFTPLLNLPDSVCPPTIFSPDMSLVNMDNSFDRYNAIVSPTTAWEASLRTAAVPPAVAAQHVIPAPTTMQNTIEPCLDGLSFAADLAANPAIPLPCEMSTCSSSPSTTPSRPSSARTAHAPMDALLFPSGSSADMTPNKTSTKESSNLKQKKANSSNININNNNNKMNAPAKRKPAKKQLSAQAQIDKVAERRRRNRESSSRCYYNRKRIIEGLDKQITTEKQKLTSLYDRALELRHENARLKKDVVLMGIALPSSQGRNAGGKSGVDGGSVGVGAGVRAADSLHPTLPFSGYVNMLHMGRTFQC